MTITLFALSFQVAYAGIHLCIPISEFAIAEAYAIRFHPERATQQTFHARVSRHLSRILEGFQIMETF